MAVRATLAAGGDPVPSPAEADGVAALVDLAAAWRGLTREHQEALSLAVFEDLTSAQAAVVLGITSTAYRLRLLRARRALRARLGRPDLASCPATRPSSTLETLP